MLHQATEGYYKTALLVFTAYRPKEHNIQTLGKRCGQVHRTLRDVFPRATREEKHRFKLLKDAYVDARYSMTYSITREQLEALAEDVRVLRNKTEQACREKIASLAKSVAR